MGSTYTSLHYHIVFSTKDRDPLIAPDWRRDLHAYIGGTVRGLEGVGVEIGGVADHVHRLVLLKPVHCLADFIREVKKSATSWVREQCGVKGFHWQDGYSGFTVSQSHVERVIEYVRGQERHHRRRSFKEELLALLDAHGVQYDERYLW